MHPSRFLGRATGLLGASLLIAPCLAQFPDLAPGTYTDAATNITFATWSTPNFLFGISLPQDAATRNVTEYIGYLRCQSPAANLTGWCGISHAGQMTNDLLLMAWPYQKQVLTSFRFIDSYFMPPPYQGNSSLAQIRSNVTADGFEVIYRCQNCFSWAQGNYTENVATAGSDPLMFGYAVAALGPTNAGCPERITFGFHEQGYGQWAVQVANVTSPSYSKWASLATKTASGSCPGTASTSKIKRKGISYPFM